MRSVPTSSVTDGEKANESRGMSRLAAREARDHPFGGVGWRIVPQVLPLPPDFYGSEKWLRLFGSRRNFQTLRTRSDIERRTPSIGLMVYLPPTPLVT